MCALIIRLQQREKRRAAHGSWSVTLVLLCVLIVWSGASKSKESGGKAPKGPVNAHKGFSPPPKGMEGRVVGGAVPRMNQFPFLIAVINFGSLSCGGSLITTSLVLTAAHCWVDSKTGKVNGEWRPMRVRGGEHNLKMGNESGFEQYADVKRLVVHKDFDRVNFLNDIALIELDRSFNLTKGVGTVALATPKTKYQETGCTVVGWGYTHAVTEADQFKSQPESMPDTPRFVQLDIIRKDKCGKFGGNETVAHPSVLCAGKLEGGKSPCMGDSGGPLTCSSLPSGEPLQVGIVSAGVGCGLPNSPRVFADVAFMEPWLAKAYKALDKSKDRIIRI